MQEWWEGISDISDGLLSEMGEHFPLCLQRVELGPMNEKKTDIRKTCKSTCQQSELLKYVMSWPGVFGRGKMAIG